MVLDTVKLMIRKSTIWPGMRGRDAAKELTLKVNTTPYTSHFLALSHITFFMTYVAQGSSRVFVVHASCAMSHLHALMC